MSRKHNKRIGGDKQILKTTIGKKLTKLDVSYPVYGEFDSLQQSINFLNDAIGNIEYKMYFCDDASPDFDPIGKEFYKTIKLNPRFGNVTYHKQNTGFARSSNDAISLGSSNYIMFMSTDIVMEPGSIKLMLEHMESNPQIGMIAPKLLFYPNSTDPNRPAGRVQSVGSFFDIGGNPYHPFMGWHPDHPLVNVVRDVNIVTGAAFLIRRSTWHKLGGFSLDYGKGYYEDIDLCLRLRMLGLTIRVLPQAVGYHYVNMSFQHNTEGLSMQKNGNILKAKFGDIIPYDDWILSGLSL
jgi:GT2 family glycosyltransferase